MSKNAQKPIEFLSSVEKMNADFLTLTYGSLMVRLIKDYEKPEEINDQLEKMGYNIGIRLIDDFLAKSCIAPPKTFEEAMTIRHENRHPDILPDCELRNAVAGVWPVAVPCGARPSSRVPR